MFKVENFNSSTSKGEEVKKKIIKYNSYDYQKRKAFFFIS